jgi:hypothetical protein
MNTTAVVDPFTELYPANFVLLTTYRKDGTPVPTPVWLAQNNGKLYVTTSSHAGKIKRIRNNGRVTLTPCDARGHVKEKAPTIEGDARELEPAYHAQAKGLLRRKYGFAFMLISLLYFLQLGKRKHKNTFIEIKPVQA